MSVLQDAKYPTFTGSSILSIGTNLSAVLENKSNYCIPARKLGWILMALSALLILVLDVMKLTKNVKNLIINKKEYIMTYT